MAGLAGGRQQVVGRIEGEGFAQSGLLGVGLAAQWVVAEFDVGVFLKSCPYVLEQPAIIDHFCSRFLFAVGNGAEISVFCRFLPRGLLGGNTLPLGATAENTLSAQSIVI